MKIVLDILLIVLLFSGLSWLADMVVRYVKKIATVLHLQMVTVGIIFGLITTLPELSLGLNATIQDVPTLAVGNLIGGMIVMLCLITGANIMINRSIVTDGNFRTILPKALIIFSPIILGIDGNYSLWDGLIMIGLYIGMIYYMYVSKALTNIPKKQTVKIEVNQLIQSAFLVLIGMVGILLISDWIINITLELLNYFKVSQLVVGLSVFAIGTNLPEIIIALTAWKKKTPDLSISHVVSSAFTNVLVLGLLASMKSIDFFVDLDFLVMGVFLLLALLYYILFYRSDKKFIFSEGVFLVVIYFLFIIATLIN